MSSSTGMEEYYQKVIQLQERLRQSEEERLKLEMRFNEMLQVMKEEEEAHFKKLRTKYKQFLDEDRRRQQRNDKILEALDRIENRAQIWEAKTEKFNVFRRKYQDYLKHASGRRSRSPLDAERSPEPKHDVYERSTLYPDHHPKGEDAKTDIMEKYLQSLSSQKCKDDILQKKNETPLPESKYSNLGNINSVYWKTPKRGEKTDSEKEDYDSTQLKITKDMENALKQNNNAPLSTDYSYSDIGKSRLMDKTYDDVNAPLSTDYSYSDLGKSRLLDKNYDDGSSFGRTPLQENNLTSGRKLSTEPETKEYKFASSVNQNNETTRRTSQQFVDDITQARALNVHNELENMLKQHKDEAQPPPFSRLRSEPLQNPPPVNLQPAQVGQFQAVPKQPPVMPKDQIQSISRPPIQEAVSRQAIPSPLNQFTNVVKADQTLVKNEETPNSQILNKQSFERPINDGLQREPQAQTQRRPSIVSKSEFDKVLPLSQTPVVAPVDESSELENKEQRTYEKVEGDQSSLPLVSNGQEQLDQTLEKHEQRPVEQASDAIAQPLKDDPRGQPSQEYVANEPYQQEYYNESGQPVQQYTENGEPVQQYDENGQPLQQYDQNGQPLEQYDQTGQQYDENGQPLPQYDENGQPLQKFYDEGGQLQSQYYDENGQPLQKYDENGQPLQQYYDNGQVQYDENGQPIAQYDQNGQPITQYDESGQPITQYDENGQPILSYDPNVQVQYDENGQPITQYDENGQPIQYDQNGQYDANGQPLTHYDENGQPLQQYYDNNGQPIQYYGEGESAQQYDESGQPLPQQYSEQPYGDQQQHYEEQQQIPGAGQQQQIPGAGQQQAEEQPQPEAKSNVLEMLETDTESTKQDTKVSNESDFDFSNG